MPVEGDGVEVQIDACPVGFLLDRDAARLRHPISRSIEICGFASCRAAIRGGWDRGGQDVGLFGVTLFVPEGEGRDRE